MNGLRVVALVAAAGRGTRLGAEIPKAYVQLRGRSLLERSVTAMETSAVVDHIGVLVSPDMEPLARELLRDHDHPEILKNEGAPEGLIKATRKCG